MIARKRSESIEDVASFSPGFYVEQSTATGTGRLVRRRAARSQPGSDFGKPADDASVYRYNVEWFA